MSDLEPRTDPDYYEKSLSEESRDNRIRLEDRLDDLDDEIDDLKGLSRLKKQKERDRIQLMLDWQGANPKELDFKELRDVIREPLHDDPIEDQYRARIKNQGTAIRAYCVMCQGGSVAGVKDCESVTCVLFPFRMGKDNLRGYEIPKAVDPEFTESELLEDDTEIYEDEDDDDDE